MSTDTIPKYQDDRTEAQRSTLTWGIIAKDKFLSGWGPGRDCGGSWACWACTFKDLERVQAWVEARSDMRYVRAVKLDKRPRVRGLLHVYATEAEHPALA